VDMYFGKSSLPIRPPMDAPIGLSDASLERE
jgi:hypothetical protein